MQSIIALCIVLLSVLPAQYPGYKWVSGSVIGAHHHGLTGHHLVVRDSFNGSTYTCTVSLATWLYDRQNGWASCWGRRGAL
jgi:hypothetical protein